MNLKEFNSENHLSNRCAFSLYANVDLSDVHSLLSLPETDVYNTFGIMKNMDETRLAMRKALMASEVESISSFNFLVRNKSDQNFIGLLGMNLSREIYRAAEIWYKLMPAQWSKGYATEAVDWMLYFAFEKLKLHRVSAGCSTENIASFRVMEKVGMRREGIGVKTLPLETGWSDTFEYAILETEFELLKRESKK